MSVLVDTSVWIEYFKTGKNVEKLDFFIDENIVVTNDLILAELIPPLKMRNQKKIIKLLSELNRFELLINWDEIMVFQVKCLKNGINGIGIPDLIIAQNANQNNCAIYTLDKHFQLMKDILKLRLTQ